MPADFFLTVYMWCVYHDNSHPSHYSLILCIAMLGLLQMAYTFKFPPGNCIRTTAVITYGMCIIYLDGCLADFPYNLAMKFLDGCSHMNLVMEFECHLRLVSVSACFHESYCPMQIVIALCKLLSQLCFSLLPLQAPKQFSILQIFQQHLPLNQLNNDFMCRFLLTDCLQQLLMTETVVRCSLPTNLWLLVRIQLLT